MLIFKRFLPLYSSILRKTDRRSIYQILSYSTAQKTQENEDHRPIKYSTSLASKHKAKTSRTGIEVERLWYEPPVIIISLTIFLLYFCVFREENDLDKDLNRSLYSRIEGLEEHQLRLSLQYNSDHGLDTTDIKQRLYEIEQEKQNAKATGK